MTIRSVSDDFFVKVPELKHEFDMQCAESMLQSTDGIYVLWGLGIMPCIVNRLKSPEINEYILRKIFIFFEEMAKSDDDVRSLLLYSVLETVGDDKAIAVTATRFMGEETAENFKKIEHFLGRG